MKVLPIKQKIHIAKNKVKSGAKYVEHKVGGVVPQKLKNTYKEKMPKKITWDNFPAVVGFLGLFTHIPGASVALYGIAKAIQVARKKFLHKP